MADGGYLAPPSKDPSKETIWVETQKRLDRFLPDLFKEIFPSAPEEIPARVPTPQNDLPHPPSEEASREEPSEKAGTATEAEIEID